jgi:oxalate decarboxylase/phosphoglucose isomerase-like protein (cupin superfamily)
MPVSAGSCIHLPPFVLPSLENGGDTPMRIVAVFHPAGEPASRRVRGKRMTGIDVSSRTTSRDRGGGQE